MFFEYRTVMKRIAALGAFLVVMGNVQAQTPGKISVKYLKFKSMEINIGEILETDPPSVVSFDFTNESAVPLEIENVISSCGCTVADWPRKAVKAGENGRIQVQFNPAGMYGELEKHIKIKANLSDAPFIDLVITGYINSTHFDAPQYYKGQYGYLMLRDYRLNFGERRQLEDKVLTISAYNDGNDTIEILGFDDVPSFMVMLVTKHKLAPGDSLDVRARFAGNEEIMPGTYKGSIRMNTTDRFYPSKGFNYSLEVLPDFSEWSRKQLRKAPKAELLNPEVNMGDMSAGGIKESVALLKNSGKSALIIYRVSSDCSCAILSHPTEIEAGQTAELPVKFDALFKSGKQAKVITLYTNDPASPKIHLMVRANVRD